MRENEPVLLVLSVCDGEIILEKGEILCEKCHMLLVLYTLVVVPYERRRLPVESAELLAKSLVAGEVTEGVPLEQEER